MRMRRSIALVAIAATVGLAAAGCGRDAGGGDAGPGVTDSTVKIGGSFPLSGPLSAQGQAQLGGLKAFFGKVNDAGGVEMGDGKTRKIEFVYYDDGYDPARIVQNFRKLVDQDKVLAFVGAFGTASNAAVMPLANQQKVPHLFLGTGASLFSADRDKNPWTIGWQPTYEAEGESFAKFLTGQNKPLKVAFLGQNDDLGKAYRTGLDKGIAGSQVTIVAQQTYERTDATLDSPISNLAASKADVLFSAVAIPKLQNTAIAKMRELNWKPTLFLPVLSNGIGEVVRPSGAASFLPNIYGAGFVKMPDNPAYANDPAMTQYLADMKKYSPEADTTIANAVWGYATGDTMVRTLKKTSEPTRQGVMDGVNGLSKEEIGLLLDGLTIDATVKGTAPVQGLRMQKYSGGQWQLVETG
jgi:branched-chain amino acid transport system substrate-binding protein